MDDDIRGQLNKLVMHTYNSDHVCLNDFAEELVDTLLLMNGYEVRKNIFGDYTVFKVSASQEASK